MDLLQLRKELKEKKPVFIRQDNPKRMKLNDKWRKPKGIHSKIRHKFKGRRKMPSPGYKSPRKVKGFHSSGLRMVSVFSAHDITKIKNGIEGAVISKSVGMKKRLQMLEKAKETKVTVLNLNVDEHISKIRNFMSSKKKEQKEPRKEEIKKEAKEKEIRHEETKEKTEKPTDENKTEDKKKTEKKEKDKLLTKKV